MDKELVQRAVHRITNPVDQPKVDIGDHGVDLVNKLFQSLKAAFPAWKQAFKDEQELDLIKKTWVKAFMENDISSVQQVQLGMRRARASDSDFFPSVGKFIKWCQPRAEDLGLPSVEQAYKEACGNSHRPIASQWSHAGVYEAGKRTGWHELRSMTEMDTRPLFNKNYEAVCKAVMNGEAMYVPVPDSTRLEHHTSGNEVKTEQSKAKAEKGLEGLREAVRGIKV